MAIFLFLLLAVTAIIPSKLLAQYRDSGFEIGILGGTAYDNSTGVDDTQPGMQGRILLAGPILPFAQWEIGGGYTELRSRDAHSILTPADMILKLSPGGLPAFFPYIFGGGGILYYRYDKFPAGVAPGTDRNGWEPFVPVGAGVQLRVNDGTQLELRGTYVQTFSPDVSPSTLRNDDDSYFGVLAGVRFKAGGGDPDEDDDGLSDRLEKSLGTDPNNADTDSDSLNDGEEYNTYKTNPLRRDTDNDKLGDGAEAQVHGTDALKADTDDDGLGDAAEISQHETNPTKPDSDADKLSDGREISETSTNPNKADTDGDGLTDGDEVMIHRTNPLKLDTDGGTIADGLEIERRTDPLVASDDVEKAPDDTDRDGLTDNDEINRYKTDPRKMDTDRGTVADGLEVERGTNPLDPDDDLPPKEVLIFELDKPVVLPGIQFEFNKAVIKPESESVLIQAYNSLHDHPEIVVEISGHADAIGSDEYNRDLSARRAESVRQWMINKGIAANRLTSIGYGESQPVASNDTEEGRALNRRIEFKRTK